MDADDTDPPAPPGRWHLARDVIAFQFKLMMDGLRDLLLSPISILAALAGLLTDGDNPGRYFYRLMHFGRDTDRWINLFGAHDDGAGADDVVRRAENALRAEYEKGGVVRQLKEGADNVIDSVRSTRQ
jgi:hypothetical protein